MVEKLNLFQFSFGHGVFGFCAKREGPSLRLNLSRVPYVSQQDGNWRARKCHGQLIGLRQKLGSSRLPYKN